MRPFVRVLCVLAVPGMVFGFLTRVPGFEFGFTGDAISVHEPWLDVATGIAIAAAIFLAAAIILGVLLALGFSATSWRR
jgi:hypothetical protein